MRRVVAKSMGVIGGMAAYHFVMRPRMLQRGATTVEAAKVLPGDEITPPDPFRSTMAR